MLTRRSWFVYGALLSIWVVLIGWQAAEHLRFRKSARAERIKDARIWSKNLGLLMRMQQRGGPPQRDLVIYSESLGRELERQVNDGVFLSVLLLNATNGEVAAAGAPVDSLLAEQLLKEEIPNGEFWNDKAQTVTLLNLVDLGTNFVVVSASDIFSANGPPGSGEGTNRPPATNATMATNAAILIVATNVSTAETNQAATNVTIASGDSTNNPPRGGFGRRGGPRFDRVRVTPELRQNKGVHNFIIALSTQNMLSACNTDLWLRSIIAILATAAVCGYGLAWGNLKKTSELQIRLVRASELNSHLKEMNLAAAGLAHETRNPLNIVRGLAQMISRREDASTEIRTRTREIIDETDRVTAQLNEFINYSRPREVRRARTNLNAVVAEVVRALNYDVDEKKVQLQVRAEPLTIEADEQLLRQALFNLVLNAIQAIPAGGEIQIRASRNGAGAVVEVADNGPGVAPEHRSELFKPYFTTHQEGTGLGLAVVQQIVLAHGWEIACLPNSPRGAIFRITHIRTAH